MYSNAIQKLWVVKWKTVAGCYSRSLEARSPSFRAFKESHSDMWELGSSFVSVCLFIKSHTVQARRGFNRGSVVLSASGRGLDIGSHRDMFMWQHHLTALTLHRQTPSKELTVYPLENIGTPFRWLPNVHEVDGVLFIVFNKVRDYLKHLAWSTTGTNSWKSDFISICIAFAAIRSVHIFQWLRILAKRNVQTPIFLLFTIKFKHICSSLHWKESVPKTHFTVQTELQG